MPDFDTTSVAATAGQNAPNALQQYGNVLQIKQAQNALQLFPMQKQLLGTQAATAQQGLQAARIGALQSALASTKDDSEVPSVVARFVKAGMIDSDTAANVLGGNVESLSPSAITAQRRQAIMQAGNANEIAAMTGTPTQVDTGAKREFVNVNPFTNTVSSMGGDASSIPNQLAPGEVNTPAYTTFINGQPHIVTKGAAATAQSGGQQLPGTDATGAIASEAPLGAAAAANVYGGGQGEDALGITRAARQVPQQKADIDNMLDQVNEFAAGPQTGLWQGIGKFFSQFGLDPSALNKNLGTNATAAAEEFNKLSKRTADQVAQQAGMTGTGALRMEAGLASPHDAMSPLGIKRNLQVMKGNLDYLAAQNTAWVNWAQAHGGTAAAADQATFQQKFNSRYDPRVFQSQYLDPEARQTMLKNMSASDRKLFQARYNDAVQRGLINADQ